MTLQVRRLETLLLLSLLAWLQLTWVMAARGDETEGQAGWGQVQAEEQFEAGTAPLEPRYAPREPAEKSWYNSQYIFGITRSVTSSTLQPAAKLPLLVLTVPLDLALLPFAAIGGLFG